MAVYFDKEKKTYYVKFRPVDKDGNKLAPTTKRGFATKKEAKQYELLAVSEQGIPTFAKFCEEYMDDYRLHRKESSVCSKQNIIARYLVPFFGRMKLTDITAMKVRKFQNSLITAKPMRGSAEAISETTRHNIIGALAAILNFAVRYGAIDVNPCSKAGNPFKRGKRMQVWTIEQFNDFIAAIPEADAPFPLMFTILMTSGMRIGELLALEKNDIDYLKNTISITKNLQFSTHKIAAPKTKTSIRTITMPEPIMRQLQEYSSHIPTPRLFNYNNPHLSFNNRIKKYAAIAKVPVITCHGLRHSHASMLINYGVPVTSISQRLGHASPKITLDVYSHFYEHSDAETAKTIEKIMEIPALKSPEK